MKVAQIFQNYGDHLKVSGARRVTWISYSGFTDVKCYRAEFSRHFGLDPGICAVLAVIILVTNRMIVVQKQLFSEVPFKLLNRLVSKWQDY